MSDILKPCPFCSSSDVLVIEDDGIHVNPKIIAVHCKSCGARGPTTGRRIDVESKIITRSRWNRRSLATQDPQGGEVTEAMVATALEAFEMTGHFATPSAIRAALAAALAQQPPKDTP